jgi:RNA polymerase sigma factor (sigma-70 family)
MTDRKPWRIEQLFTEKSAAVQAFFRRRLRATSQMEALDLTQEVYSRVLHAERLRPINDPEAYLFTVARHLLEEYAVGEQRRQARTVDFADPLVTVALTTECTVDREIDQAKVASVLREAMRELPPPCLAALFMAYRDGLSYSQIAECLGVSKPMVQKYLGQAMSYCRQQVLRRGPRLGRSGRQPKPGRKL